MSNLQVGAPQQWLSRIVRGSCHFVRGAEAPVVAARLRARNGLVFVEPSGELVHELYPDHREKLYELFARSPLAEIRHALDPRARRDLLPTLLRFSCAPGRAQFVAGLTWEFDPAGATFRLREMARDLSRSDATATQRLLDAAESLARALGARRLTAQTHDGFGRKLLALGWRLDPRGTPLLVRLGAALSRDRCYARDLGVSVAEPG